MQKTIQDLGPKYLTVQNIVEADDITSFNIVLNK
jgi:hypothetical protein